MDGLIAYALSKKYADSEIQKVINAGFKVQVEQDRSILNRTGEEMVLYFIPKTTGSTNDGYDEFIYAQNAWEWVGKTDVDLSNYATKTDIGDLSNLSTTDKTSIVSAINETFQSVSNGKNLVASAITDKGIATASDATFLTMAQNIGVIDTFLVPIDSNSNADKLVFGIDDDGIYMSDIDGYKTDVKFGTDQNGLYVV